MAARLVPLDKGGIKWDHVSASPPITEYHLKVGTKPGEYEWAVTVADLSKTPIVVPLLGLIPGPGIYYGVIVAISQQGRVPSVEFTFEAGALPPAPVPEIVLDVTITIE